MKSSKSLTHPAKSSFPLWPETDRALPTSFARSALFTVGSTKHKRPKWDDTKIATAAGIDLIFSGEELRQDDEDVFLQLLHLTRGRPPGEPIFFMAHALLQELEWVTSVQGYTRLRTTLDRMQSGKIKLQAKEGRKGFVGSLISSWGWDEDEQSTSSRAKMFVRFEPAILEVFGMQPYTQLQWAERNSLDSTVAKWLHSFMMSKPTTLSIQLSELVELTGSRAGTMTVFRNTLRKALTELKDKGVLGDWRLDRDYLFLAPKGEALMRLLPGSVLDFNLS